VDVNQDAAGAREMIRVSGQSGVPVITVGQQVVVGFDQRRLEQLLELASRPSLGIAVSDAAKYLPGATGAYVGVVKAGTAGMRAGLRKGDVITQLNGLPVRGADDLEAAVAGLKAGAKVLLVWRRDDETKHDEFVISADPYRRPGGVE
jgi:putative serine protease PepD